MADNNKNPRRTIWLSETEPLSHYDIWLSKNQHLNSDGLPISDTGVLRPCDYIFKVWDCDNWYPIIGFNSTAVNKIDTVYNQSYHSTNPNTGHTIDSSSYLEFHLPLFTKPECSPAELFDAGTIGEAIYLYVTELEWLNIFEGDAFTNAFEYYFPTIINNGGININTLIKPAEKTKLGGIWADEFQIEDMFPTLPYHTNYTDEAITESYNWIALAKYKYNHGTSDYNLYVSAKDVIGAINHYLIYNPEAPGIQPGNDFEWRLANPVDIGGIRSDTHESLAVYAFKPVEVKFYPSTWHNNLYNGRLSVNAWDVQEALNEIWQEHPGSEIVSGWKGVETLLRDGLQGVWIGLDGLDTDKVGKFCMAQLNNSDPSGVSIEWVDLPEYERLGPDSVEANNYVVKGCGNSKLYLNGAGEWTPPSGPDYWGDRFIYVDRTEARITLAPIRETGSFYIDCTNGILDWKPILEQHEYPVLSSISHNVGPYVINGCGNELFPNRLFLNGNGEWTEISEGESYNSGIGINIDSNNNINIKTTNATAGQVLSYDGNGVEWITILTGLTYTEGSGIDINSNNKISCNIEDAQVSLLPQGSSISLAVSWTALRDSLTISDQNDFSLDIYVYEVCDLSSILCDYAFNLINGGVLFNNNNPIYLKIQAKNITLQNGTKYIYNGLGNLSGGIFLVTIQFGVIKFELINTLISTP